MQGAPSILAVLTISEQERLANIAENERLLQELGIAGGGSSVFGTIPEKRPSGELVKRQRKRTQKESKPTRVQPQRTSARLQGAKPEDSASDLYAVCFRLTQEQAAAEREREKALRVARHEDLSFYDMTDGHLDDEDKVRLRSTLDVRNSKVTAKSLAEPQTELESLLQSTRLRSHERVAQKRIYSMLYHPTLDKDLIFTGDQEGILGIWDALAPSHNEDTEDTSFPSGSSFTLQLHARSAIGCLRMDPGSQDRLYSSSYDASIRLLSLSTGGSNEIWAAPPDVQLGEFDILAPQVQANTPTFTPAPQLDERSIWLSDHRGGLLHLDVRHKAATVHRWQVSDKKVCCIFNTDREYVSQSGSFPLYSHGIQRSYYTFV